MNATLAALARQVIEAARAQNLSLVTAESCTAGKLEGMADALAEALRVIQGPGT
jgi:nicotinamide mononucleotide (NMN) deamidase PncC